jgi:hypothetical protein
MAKFSMCTFLLFLLLASLVRVESDDAYHWQRWSPNLSKAAGAIQWLSSNSSLLVGGSNNTFGGTAFSVMQRSNDVGKTFPYNVQGGHALIAALTFVSFDENQNQLLNSNSTAAIAGGKVLLASGALGPSLRTPSKLYWSKSVDNGDSWQDFGTLSVNSKDMGYLYGSLVARALRVKTDKSPSGYALVSFGFWGNAVFSVSGMTLSFDDGATNVIWPWGDDDGHAISGASACSTGANCNTFFVAGGRVPKAAMMFEADDSMASGGAKERAAWCAKFADLRFARGGTSDLKRLAMAQCMRDGAAPPAAVDRFIAILKRYRIVGNLSHPDIIAMYRIESEPNATAGGFFLDTHFFNETHGVVLLQNWTCCGEGRSAPQNFSIMATSDGGVTMHTVFELREAGTSWQAARMFFANDRTGYVLGGNVNKGFYGTGLLLKTVDGGLSWESTQFADVALLTNAWHCSDDLLFINTESVFQFSNLYRYATHAENVNDCPNGASS